MASNKKEIARLEGKIKALALSVLIFEVVMWYVSADQDKQLRTTRTMLNTHTLAHHREAEYQQKIQDEAEAKKATK
jgi:hypothetical protein